VNPYGASKAFATDLVRVWRDAHGLFAVNGILYNHESPRRGPEFVTGKICRAAAAIKLGRQSELKLGDTSAQRDWGNARDFVEGFWLSLQAKQPDDYVFATGKVHSVQDVIQVAFTAVGLDWRQFVKTDSSLFRPAEPTRMVGNPAKARRELGWEPRTPFRRLITEMTESALQAA
jgi:GDPmannose 4,6-dehydratase